MITVEYDPGRVRGEGKLSRALVEKVAEAVSRALRLKESFTISLALVDGPTIRRVNRACRGKDAETDVLAFTYDDGETFGEILICPAYARTGADEDGRTLKAEIVELLVHGLLHVFGYDHIRPSDARRMLPLQKRLVAELL